MMFQDKLSTSNTTTELTYAPHQFALYLVLSYWISSWSASSQISMTSIILSTSLNLLLLQLWLMPNRNDPLHSYPFWWGWNNKVFQSHGSWLSWSSFNWRFCGRSQVLEAFTYETIGFTAALILMFGTAIWRLLWKKQATLAYSMTESEPKQLKISKFNNKWLHVLMAEMLVYWIVLQLSLTKIMK